MAPALPSARTAGSRRARTISIMERISSRNCRHRATRAGSLRAYRAMGPCAAHVVVSPTGKIYHDTTTNFGPALWDSLIACLTRLGQSAPDLESFTLIGLPLRRPPRITKATGLILANNWRTTSTCRFLERRPPHRQRAKSLRDVRILSRAHAIQSGAMDDGSPGEEPVFHAVELRYRQTVEP